LYLGSCVEKVTLQFPPFPQNSPTIKGMKETFYFSHDYHARTDEKIIELLSKE